MKTTQHRNGDITLRLTSQEAADVWGLVREGRRAHIKAYASYSGSQFGLDIMHATTPNSKYVDPNYVRYHIERFK